MTEPARTLRGKHQSHDGAVTELLATIGRPTPEKGQRDWSCIVRCPFLFATDKRIVGADADQAPKLAEAFLRDLLEHHGVQIDDSASGACP